MKRIALVLICPFMALAMEQKRAVMLQPEGPKIMESVIDKLSDEQIRLAKAAHTLLTHTAGKKYTEFSDHCNAPTCIVVSGATMAVGATCCCCLYGLCTAKTVFCFMCGLGEMLFADHAMRRIQNKEQNRTKEKY